MTAIAAIIIGLAGLISLPAVLDFAPVLSPGIAALLLGGLALAASDVAYRSLRDMPLRVSTFMIVSLVVLR
ncbi:hypothetical protein FHR32_000315 [Streptosporangium album]|uniref:Uncharacterized protein n=1 Tax=Streptosporangium album TaxID=47479 RepID=A0A7W7RPY5_9ACTN|nr:hypothetical protein [Streptosporangium album]MBB4936010.1 hypothetical protein [Streptosporangium album]